MAAQRGELQKVVKWLRKGGCVDAVYSGMTSNRQASTFFLLHTAANFGHLEMLRVLLRRGATVDLPTSFGVTALMTAANNGQLLTLDILLRHSANIGLQDRYGMSSLMMAASQGHEACVKALLCAKSNTELFDHNGRTALQLAEDHGFTATVSLMRQHMAPPQPAAVSPAAPLDAGEPGVSSPAPLPEEIHQAAERGELQKVWSSGCARERWSTRSAPLHVLTAFPQPQPCCTPPQPGATWRW